MTQNNFRKEPSFGEPSIPAEKVSAESSPIDATEGRPYVSLHSNPTVGQTSGAEINHSEPVVHVTLSDSPKTAKEFAFTPSAGNEPQITADESVTAFKGEATESVPTEPTAAASATSAKNADDGLVGERIIPNVTLASAAVEAEETKQTAVKAQMPPKARRLLLVALAVLVLLVLFFLLKPSTPETVEELQSQQGSSLPIEFRPVDEVEARRAEEQARAEREAAAQQAAQNAQNAMQPASPNTPPPQPIGVEPETPPTANDAVVVRAGENNTAIKPQSQSQYRAATAAANEPTKPQARFERVTPPKEPAQAQKEQPKTAAKPEKAPAKTEPAVKAAAAKPTTPATVKATAAAPAVKTAASEAAAGGAVSTKTLTVPKGVSLMQVFRDNNLNISDVNAMSKVNGVVSNLKVGERITVRLDKNDRVVEMSIGSGGKFTRQANGGYTFK